MSDERSTPEKAHGRESGMAAHPRSAGSQVARALLLLVIVPLCIVLNGAWISAYWPHKQGCTAAPAPKTPGKPPLRMAGELCTSPKLEALRQHLGNVVLVININYRFAAYNTSSFLRQLYGRFFLDVVLIGPRDIPQLGVAARAHYPWNKRWCYSYYYFPSLVAQYPSADGYLWMNDDVVLNYWTLIDANLNKLWIPDTPDCWKPEKPGCEPGGPVAEPEICRCQGNIPFSGNASADIEDGWSSKPWHRLLVKKAWSSLPRKFRRQHARSMKSKRFYRKVTVDAFYVPRRLSMTMAFKLIPSFQDQGVWSEVAIPLMFHAMESPKLYDPIFKKMVYRWERKQDYNPLDYWNSSQSAFHHWKLASRKAKIDLLHALRSNDMCLDVLLDKLESGNDLVTVPRFRTSVINASVYNHSVSKTHASPLATKGMTSNVYQGM